MGNGATPTVPGGPLRGVCWITFAFDIGLSTDLAAAERALQGVGTHRRRLGAAAAGTVGGIADAGEHVPPKGPSAQFAYRPPPLVVRLEGSAVAVRPGDAGCVTEAAAEGVLYDFGAATVTYRIAFQADPEELVRLSEALYENAPLIDDARARARALLARLGGAVSRPGLSPLVEDYHVWRLEEPAGEPDAETWLAAHAAWVARLLRAECRSLAPSQRSDALASRLSYGERDMAIVDWNAALLMGSEGEDARAILEFANVELLEVCFLDDRLDEALERAYQAVRHDQPPWAWARQLFGRPAAELEQTARLLIDSALLFEEVNNALKLLGDQHLARLYGLAARRFHLPEWDASILRKMHTVESVHDKLAGRQTNRRMEVLEWIVIVLIALEIVLALR
ncbi:MAG: hypothetical protein JNM07_12785 [Phycisphaerae bacterium]|nr:hypothetical protein [Phycisphaerae bacterium]